MAPKSVTFRRHDHLVSVLFGDLLSHSYNITFSMFLDLVYNYNHLKDVLAVFDFVRWHQHQLSECYQLFEGSDFLPTKQHTKQYTVR